MAKFKTACPSCSSAISVYSEWAGKKATCPVCRSIITVPPMPAGTLLCPACGKEQPSGQAGYVVCDSCGESCMHTPELSFKCARTLPPAPDGIPRLACPYCGRHYILSFTPRHGLIGCQDCMNIFACPSPAEPKQKPAEKPAYTTMVLTPGLPPVPPAAGETFPEAAMKTMQLTPQLQKAPSVPAISQSHVQKTIPLEPQFLAPQPPQESLQKTMQLTPRPLTSKPIPVLPRNNAAVPASSPQAEQLLSQPAFKPQYQTDQKFANSANTAFSGLHVPQTPPAQTPPPPPSSLSGKIRSIFSSDEKK